MSSTEFKLVLSGGGLKGLSHVGVLMALEERGLVPSLVVGSSMGAMVAATWATGMAGAEMRERAMQVRIPRITIKRAILDVGLTSVVATQLWHHIYCGGGLCDLPEWSPPDMDVKPVLPECVQSEKSPVSNPGFPNRFVAA